MAERRLFACFILTVALWLNIFSVYDASASLLPHRHKHHNNNSNHGHQHRHHSTSQHANHSATSNINNNNNNNASHNSVGSHMQSTHYERYKTLRHISLLHRNKTIAMHNISTQSNRTVMVRAAVTAATPNAIIASTSTQRTTGTVATATAIKSQKLSLINAHPVFNRFGGNVFNGEPSLNRWPAVVATDNARRIDTTNWRINFNTILTTAAPNGIVRRVIFNDQRIFTKPHVQRG